MPLTWTPPGVGRNFLTVAIPPKMAKNPLDRATYRGLLEMHLQRMLEAEGEDAAVVAEELAAMDGLLLRCLTPSQIAAEIMQAEAMGGAMANGPPIKWPVSPEAFQMRPEWDPEDGPTLSDLMGRLYP